MEQKPITTWQVALLHFIIAGAIAPFLVRSLLGDGIGTYVQLSGEMSFMLFTFVLPVLVVWLAARYSAGFLSDRYAIRDPKSVASLSTLFLIVVGGIGVFWITVAFWFGTGGFLGDNIYHYIPLISLAAQAMLFYVNTKKYLRAAGRVG